MFTKAEMLPFHFKKNDAEGIDRSHSELNGIKKNLSFICDESCNIILVYAPILQGIIPKTRYGVIDNAVYHCSSCYGPSPPCAAL